MTEICEAGARTLARWIRTRRLSATEAMRAFIARIERANPLVNAIVTFVPERALAAARTLDRALARRGHRTPGLLAGLPIAYKDLVPTRGIRTTFGSLVYRDHVPREDALLVERLAAAGAITIGKTNTPEFGAGGQTFNRVFGATRNPYDLTKTAGGSSGGAAAAVACGMLPFADGSDLAASLRNPASFCNVVGFRPSPGRVPVYPAPDGWDTLAVAGPIARSVADCAFLLAAMAGADARAPLSISEPGARFLRPLGRDFRGVRVAWSRDLGGLPMDARVLDALAPARRTFEDLGCIVEDACPDFSGATEAFETLRALSFAQRYAPLLAAHRDKLKETVAWNIEQGLALGGAQVARALALRTELFHRVRRFFEKYAFLACPTSPVPPFPVEEEYPREIGGVAMTNYLDWMKSCYFIALTGHPAISVPAAFTADSPPLPVGLQIVGRHRDDFGVLALAHAFERARRAGARRPTLPSAAGP